MNYDATALRIWTEVKDTGEYESATEFFELVEDEILKARGYDTDAIKPSDDIAVDVYLNLWDELQKAVTRTLASIPEREPING